LPHLYSHVEGIVVVDTQRVLLEVGVVVGVEVGGGVVIGVVVGVEELGHSEVGQAEEREGTELLSLGGTYPQGSRD